MSRQEQITSQRRRRNSDALAGRGRKLSVDMSELDTEKYTYRFANDEGDRLHDLTVKDDWDVVSDRSGKTKDDGTGAGSEISVRAGGGIKSVLLRKPKKFYDEDYAATQRRIDDLERGMKAGAVPGGDSEGTYVPGGKSSPMTQG